MAATGDLLSDDSGPTAQEGPGEAVNRLLVVKLGDIGDAILATPALRALRTTWPKAEIDVMCSANGASALEALPGVHELIVVNKKNLDRPAGLLNPWGHVGGAEAGRPAALPAL